MALVSSHRDVLRLRGAKLGRDKRDRHRKRNFKLRRGRHHGHGHGTTCHLPVNPSPLANSLTPTNGPGNQSSQAGTSTATPSTLPRDLTRTRHSAGGRDSMPDCCRGAWPRCCDLTITKIQAALYACLPGFNFHSSNRLTDQELCQLADHVVLADKHSGDFVKRITCFLVQLLSGMLNHRDQYSHSDSADFFESRAVELRELKGRKFSGIRWNDQCLRPINGNLVMRVIQVFALARKQFLSTGAAPSNKEKKTSNANFENRARGLAAPVHANMDKWIKFVDKGKGMVRAEPR